MATMSEHEARLQILFDTMVEGVVLIARDGQIMEANPAAERILGLLRSDITGRNYIAPDWKILRPDGTPMPAEEMAGPRAMKERRPIKDVVMGVERSDGSVAWINVNASPILNPAGECEAFIETFSDITERRRAEQSIRESERSYRVLADNIPQKIFLKDSNSVYISCNRNYAEDLGIKPEDIPGRTDYEFYPKELAEKYIADDRRVMESGKTERFEETYTVQGQQRVVETFKTPVRDENGKPVALLGTFHDVTERRQAELAREKAERNYRLLAENTTDVISIFDMDLNLVWVSPSIERQTGYTPEEIKEIPPLETMTPESIERVIEEFNRGKQLYEEGKEFADHFELEAEVYRKDGSTSWCDVRYEVIRDSDGEPSYILMQGRDITEHKKADEALRERKELYDQLAEQSRTIAWEVDAAGLYTYIGPVVEEITGYNPEEIVGKMHFYDLHPEEGREAFKAAAFEVFKRKDSLVNLDNILVARDGRVAWVTTNGAPLIDADGALRGYRGSDTDITERKQAETALRESEEKSRAIVEVMPDMIFRLGSDGQYIDIKSYAEDNLAMSKEELLKKSIKEVLPSEASALVIEAIRRAITTKEVQIVEYVLGVQAGTRTFEARIARLNRDEVLAFVRDITEHREAEEALRQSEERYRFITDNTSDSIWALGPDLRMIYQSPSTERLFGYTLEEWHKIGWDDYVHPDHLDAITDLLNSFRRGQREGDATISVRVRDKHGKELWAEISASPVRGPDGEFAGVVGITRDITERKEAEERLVEYRAAVEQSADGIAMSDLAGNIRFVNEAWATMHGYAVAELIGRHLSVFHTREQMESQVSPFNQRLWQTGSQEGEVWHVRRSGEVFPTWMTTTLLRRADGEPFGMFAFVRDITEQKELERQQHDREIAEARADELSKSRRRLIEAQESLRKDIASQLHGTVQNRLILLAHKLAELEARPASERTTEELAGIRHRLEELQRDHIRPISHRLFPSILRLGIAAGLESLVDEYSSQLPIDLRVSKNLRDGEQADRRLVPDDVKLALYRVADEVLVNILKHTPTVNSIVMKLSLSDGGILRLTVSDDGSGFQKPSRSHGIGLALISDYAAAAGGSCTVKSVPGKGTRVTAQVQLAETEAGRRRKGRTSG